MIILSSSKMKYFFFLSCYPVEELFSHFIFRQFFQRILHHFCVHVLESKEHKAINWARWWWRVMRTWYESLTLKWSINSSSICAFRNIHILHFLFHAIKRFYLNISLSQHVMCGLLMWIVFLSFCRRNKKTIYIISRCRRKERKKRNVILDSKRFLHLFQREGQICKGYDNILFFSSHISLSYHFLWRMKRILLWDDAMQCNTIWWWWSSSWSRR